MFELATLGLLHQEPLHGYRLKQQLEEFMSACISVNYGTIYPLLKRLEQRGAIAVVPDPTDSGRKIYSITDSGRELWKQQMMEHPQESWVNARSRFMIKFFFFSGLTPAERIKLLEYRLMVCHLRLEAQKSQPPLTDPYHQEVLRRCDQVLIDEIDWLTKRLSVERASQAEIDPQAVQARSPL